MNDAGYQPFLRTAMAGFMVKDEPVKSEIPMGYIPYDFEYDGSAEDLVFADMLTEGMVVLSDDYFRGPTDFDQEYRRRNRWCRVTELRVSEHEVSFIGVYHSERKEIRRSPLLNGWYVKKDSFSHSTLTSEKKVDEDEADL